MLRPIGKCSSVRGGDKRKSLCVVGNTVIGRMDRVLIS